MSNYVDAAFTKKHLQDGRTKVINVLSKERYAEGHLPGSLNVPEDSPDFLDQVQRLVPDRSTPVIVHCSSMECQASTKAARKLESHGYREVYDFKAGLQGWKEAGSSFESGPQPSAPSATEQTAQPSQVERSPGERPPRPGREKTSHREQEQTREAPPL